MCVFLWYAFLHFQKKCSWLCLFIVSQLCHSADLTEYFYHHPPLPHCLPATPIFSRQLYSPAIRARLLFTSPICKTLQHFLLLLAGLLSGCWPLLKLPQPFVPDHDYCFCPPSFSLPVSVAMWIFTCWRFPPYLSMSAAFLFFPEYPPVSVCKVKTSVTERIFGEHL